MKIQELIRELESAAGRHGNINVSIPTDTRGHYTSVVNVQVNKNKGESLDGYPIVELDDQVIIVIR